MQNITKRLIVWAVVVAFILLIPLVLTLLGSGVDGEGWHWTLGDFIVMGVLLFGTGFALDFAVRKLINPIYRVFAVIAIVIAFLLIWVEIAVDGVSQALALFF